METSREPVFRAFGRGLDQVGYLLPDGSEAIYYISVARPTVSIVALTREQRVIMVEQYRPGPGDLLRELPGGFIDENETPSTAAERELLEETGYRGSVELHATCYLDAYSSAKKYCFTATDCVPASAPSDLDPEVTRVVLVTIDDLRRALREGRMTDVDSGLLGLQHLGLL
ncbi:NUDIX hydrolase [Actinoallomurus sp. CA-142502]|uniref:NUDIX hydrolase n=1 Tax=Actinoallomurus sp. CA-142502 TaxID=3239885 RepID=UPI003D8CE61B